MNQTTTNAVPNKVNRSLRLVRAPHPTAPGKLVVTETKGGKTTTTSYLLTLLDSELGGRAFQVEKIGREEGADGSVTFAVVERYSVLLAGDQSSCDCKWGCFGANKKPCRHVAALQMLAATGKLDAPVMECQPV